MQLAPPGFAQGLRVGPHSPGVAAEPSEESPRLHLDDEVGSEAVLLLVHQQVDPPPVDSEGDVVDLHLAFAEGDHARGVFRLLQIALGLNDGQAEHPGIVEVSSVLHVISFRQTSRVTPVKGHSEVVPFLAKVTIA